MATSQRIIMMKEGFMEQHKNGKIIPEIAKVYGVSTMSVYNNLQEIADKNGVSRESLLLKVNKPHEMTNPRKKKSQEKINPKELLQAFDEIHERIRNIMNTIDNVLQEKE